MKNNINIIGAGIGGLTTALTLKQKGFDVSIFESADEIKPVGAGIFLSNNAMQVFKKLGIHEKLENAGNPISTLKITDRNLKPLSIVSLTEFDKKYSVKSLAIHRGDLQKILANEIGMKTIQFSKRLLRIEEKDDYLLTFQNNTTLQINNLIGADGIKSIVRNQLFTENTIRDAHQICWRGVCEVDLSTQYDQEMNEAWGNGTRFGFIKINHKKVYWFALANDKINSKIDLSILFKDFHCDILNIIKATDKNKIIITEIMDLEPIKKWYNKNVCLLGDAAHATTPNLGQGACQAIEDAYVLGICLEHETEIQKAFKKYAHLRIKKAHMIVQNSWKIGKLAHIDNIFAVWLRNNIMKSMSKSVTKKQMEMIFNIDYGL